MDRNKDGYITKGELKLAKKKMSMKEVDETIKDYDLDNDGKYFLTGSFYLISTLL